MVLNVIQQCTFVYMKLKEHVMIELLLLLEFMSNKNLDLHCGADIIDSLA